MNETKNSVITDEEIAAAEETMKLINQLPAEMIYRVQVFIAGLLIGMETNKDNKQSA